MIPRTYGWKRPLARVRTYMVEAPLLPIPDHVDPIGVADPIDDQGQLGSCTGNACADLLEIVLKGKMQASYYQRSRLFAYYNARQIEGTTAQDAGATIRDVVAGALQYGVAPESWWPYVPAKFATHPSKSAYAQAAKMKAIVEGATPINGLQSVLRSLASGSPVIFGFSVPESFESDETAQTGVVPFPAPSEQIIGGHAVVAVGYDNRDRSPFVWVRNSWGANWGAQAPNASTRGYFKMDQQWFSDPSGMADDMWVIHPN